MYKIHITLCLSIYNGKIDKKIRDIDDIFDKCIGLKSKLLNVMLLLLIQFIIVYAANFKVKKS